MCLLSFLAYYLYATASEILQRQFSDLIYVFIIIFYVNVSCKCKGKAA